MCTECPSRLARDLEAGFRDLVVHHQDLVYGMAVRLTGRAADAEDLAQEAFVRAYRALATYPPDRRAGLRTRGWLAAIVLNLARNDARGRRDARMEPWTGHDRAADPRHEPGTVAERRETAREWRARLDTLPTRYRQAVELRHVHGLSYPELAEALDRPMGTVKSDVHRGIVLLRQSLEAEGVVASDRAGADGGWRQDG